MHRFRAFRAANAHPRLGNFHPEILLKTGEARFVAATRQLAEIFREEFGETEGTFEEQRDAFSTLKIVSFYLKHPYIFIMLLKCINPN